MKRNKLSKEELLSRILLLKHILRKNNIPYCFKNSNFRNMKQAKKRKELTGIYGHLLNLARSKQLLSVEV